MDRGDDGDLVIRYIEKLIFKKRVLGCIGNHDKYILDLVNKTYNIEKVIFNVKHNGFLKTLLLGTNNETIKIDYNLETLNIISDNIKQKYPIFIKWLNNLPLYLEYKNHVIVHGFIDFSIIDWHKTNKRYATWQRGYKDNIPNTFEKKIIFGHTPNHYINNQNDIIYRGKKIMIDGGAASGLQINVLVLTDKEI